MRRREFIAGLAFATAAGATRVRSAQRVFRLALISNDPRDLADPAKRAKSEFYSALFGELRRLGYAEGENLSLEWFSVATDTLSEILPEVLQSKPDVIYATMPAVLALNRASNGIPVVTVTGDPVVWGLSQSLSKPDGNVTGLTTDGGGIEMREKHLQIISELVGRPISVGLLIGRRYLPSPASSSFIAVGKRLSMSLMPVPVQEPLGPEQYRRAIQGAVQRKIGGLLVIGNEHIPFHRTIVTLAAEEKIPALYNVEPPVRMGGLAAYAIDLNDSGRQLAGYLDRIFKGAAVADLPFSQPTSLRLIINMKTARELGLTIPPTLLARADEVIE
jgi:ABC-type uncharacterized transport system substrate-binding protein